MNNSYKIQLNAYQICYFSQCVKKRGKYQNLKARIYSEVQTSEVGWKFYSQLLWYFKKAMRERELERAVLPIPEQCPGWVWAVIPAVGSAPSPGKGLLLTPGDKEPQQEAAVPVQWTKNQEQGIDPNPDMGFICQDWQVAVGNPDTWCGSQTPEAGRAAQDKWSLLTRVCGHKPTQAEMFA